MTNEEAIKLIDDRMCFGRGRWSEHHQPVIDEYWQAGEMAIKALEQPKTGKWIEYEQEFMLEGSLNTVQKTVKECSACTAKIAGMVGIMNFCPNCGADMREVNRMDDLISRQQAIDVIDKEQKEIDVSDVSAMYAYSKCKTIIKQLPSAQPETGKWISADAIFGGVPFYCSECGENTRDTVMGKPRYNFCPMCGAKMEVTI